MTQAEMTHSGTSSSGSSGSQAKEELKADADRLKDTAKDRARDEADRQKSQATRTARSASGALEKAAGELDDDQDAPGWLSSAFRETAKGIDRFAGKVDSRDSDQMGRDVSRFAREHPGSFLAASAAAGFAAARFLRAGADYNSHQPAGTDPSDHSEIRSSTNGGARFAGEARAAQQRNATGGLSR